MNLKLALFLKIFILFCFASISQNRFNHEKFTESFCHNEKLKLISYRDSSFFISFNGIQNPIVSGSIDSLWLYKSQSKVFVFNGNNENKLKLFMKKGRPMIKFRDTLWKLNDGFLEEIKFEKEVKNKKNVYYIAKKMFKKWNVRFRHNELINKIGDIEFYSDKRKIEIDYTYSGKKSVRSDYDFFFIQENRVSKTYHEFNSSYLFRILNFKKYPEGYAISDKGDNYLISIITNSGLSYIEAEFFKESGLNVVDPKGLYNYKNNILKESRINIKICKNVK